FIGKIVHRADDADGPAPVGSAAILLGDAGGRGRVGVGFDVTEIDVMHALAEHMAHSRLGGFRSVLGKFRREEAPVAHEAKDDWFLVWHNAPERVLVLPRSTKNLFRRSCE